VAGKKKAGKKKTTRKPARPAKRAKPSKASASHALFPNVAWDALRALRKKDANKNLVERWKIVVRHRPDLAERRLGYVPMIAEHGWAVIAIGGESFAYTIGLEYRFDHPELLVAAPDLDAAEFKVLLNTIATYVSLGNRIAAGEPVDLQEAGVTLVFRTYSHAVFEKYPTGYLATFEHVFEDREHTTGGTLPVLWAELTPSQSERVAANV
jgi:hypothetical protein